MVKQHRVYVDLFNQFFTFDSKYRMSDFHLFMTSVCVDIIQKSKIFQRLGGTVSITQIRDLNLDNRLPDIYTPYFDVEVETGLKYGYNDLIGRILSTKKMVIVVLPNDKVKQRYLNHVKVRQRHLKIVTLAEFQNAVYQTLKNVNRR